MNTYTEKSRDNKSQAAANSIPQKKGSAEPAFQFRENNPGTTAPTGWQGKADNSLRVKQLRAYQAMANAAGPKAGGTGIYGKQLRSVATGNVIQRNPDKIVKAVSGYLSYGAGNRKSDLERTSGESAIRVNAAKSLGRKNRGNMSSAIEEINLPGDMIPFMKEAMTGVMLKAGNCMEHAAIAFFLAIEAYPGSDIYIMDAAGLDHAFVLVCKRGESLEDGLVIDGWQVQDNNKKLKNSSWTGSTKYRIKAAGDGANYLSLALSKLTIDDKDTDNAIEKSRKEIQSSGKNPFKIYTGL